MVSVGYMIDNPGPPSGVKRFVNRHIIPPAVDAAGAVECAAYELGEQVRAQPAMGLLTAAALGFVLGATLFGLARRSNE